MQMFTPRPFFNSFGGYIQQYPPPPKRVGVAGRRQQPVRLHLNIKVAL